MPVKKKRTYKRKTSVKSKTGFQRKTRLYLLALFLIASVCSYYGHGLYNDYVVYPYEYVTSNRIADMIIQAEQYAIRGAPAGREWIHKHLTEKGITNAESKEFEQIMDAAAIRALHQQYLPGVKVHIQGQPTPQPGLKKFHNSEDKET